MPKFVIDEDMPRSTTKTLQEQGYEVKDIRDYGLRGEEDNKIFQFAQENQSVIITEDIDFGNIIKFPLGNHYGIIIVHFPNEMSNKEMNNQLINNIKDIDKNDFKGNLIIIEPGKIRIKRFNK